MLIVGIIISCILILGFLIYASTSIGSGVYIKAVLKGDTKKNTIYLSFDDGPDEEFTPVVLDILKENNIQALFFCIGNKAQKHPNLIKRIVEEGHLLGNHSFSHSSSFPVFNRNKIREELSLCNKVLEDISGRKIYLFRPPFGVTNPNIAHAVKNLNLKTIGWSMRSFDTCGANADSVLRRIEKKMKPGGILLLHDNLPFSGELLRMLIAMARDKNYNFDTIDNLIKI